VYGTGITGVKKDHWKCE